MTQTIKTAPSIPGACPYCSQPVTGEHLLAMGQKWHSVIKFNKYEILMIRITLIVRIAELLLMANFMNTTTSLNVEIASNRNTIALNVEVISQANTLWEAAAFSTLIVSIVIR